MAAERGLAYIPSQPGEYVSGRLAGSVNLVSGRFAKIDDGLGFQLVPWQPVLEKQIGRHISGVSRDGGVEWRLGRNRGLGLQVNAFCISYYCSLTEPRLRTY
jgi:hypothetical protein